MQDAPPWIQAGDREEAPPPFLSRDEEPRYTPEERAGVPSGRFPARSDENHPVEGGGRGGREANPWDTPLGREISTAGTEALAWYLPFHCSRVAWGIYFRESGLLFLADYLESAGVPSSFSLPFAHAYLDAHEEVHGMVEAVAAVQELIGGRATYLVKPKAAASPYLGRLTLAELEEALGNAYAVSRRGLAPARNALEEFAEKYQPAGYRDLREVAWWQSFYNGANAVFDQLAGAASLGSAPWLPYLHWSRSQAWEIPRWLVRDAKPGEGVIWGFRYDGVELEVHFSNEHPPPHFHVRFPPWPGHDRAYTYPDILPARSKDPPLNSRQRRTVLEAIKRYPKASFETEFERHRSIVVEKAQSIEAQRRLESLETLDGMRKGREITEDEYAKLRRKIEGP